METADRVAVRMWITTERQRESPTELELVLIATFLDGKLHRLWELTWPGRVTDGRLRGVPRRPQAALSRTTRSRCRNRYRMRTSAAPAPHRRPDRRGSIAIDRGPSRCHNSAVTSTLPRPLSSFIGREDVLAEAGALLARNRLLTMTGPGGSGKTRLSIELAVRVGSELLRRRVLCRARRDPGLGRSCHR